MNVVVLEIVSAFLISLKIRWHFQLPLISELKCLPSQLVMVSTTGALHLKRKLQLQKAIINLLIKVEVVFQESRIR